MRGSGARVVPWLQDFSLGVGTASATCVRRSTHASRRRRRVPALDPRVTYAGGALTPNAPLPTIGSRDGAGVAAAREAAVVRSPDDPVRSGLAPNEFGVVPVLMYPALLPDGGGDYDLTPAGFRAELARLSVITTGQ